MKKLRKTLNETLCSIGFHNWVYKNEEIDYLFPRSTNQRKRINYYRICTKCYKSQSRRISDFDGVRWITETKKQMSHRKELIRSIKLDKLVKKIKS